MKWFALLFALAGLGLFIGCFVEPEPRSLAPSARPSTLTLTLAAEGATIGHRLRFRTGGPAALTRGARGVYRHAAFDEWYEPRPEGIEQGFDVPARPAGQRSLRIDMELGDFVVAPTSTPSLVDLEDAHHVRAFRYGALAARDATGKALTARFSFTPGEARIAIDVDDHDARYPVAIDPLIWALSTRIERVEAEARDGLGGAIAFAPDEAIVTARGAHGFTGRVFSLRHDDGRWLLTGIPLADAGAGKGDGSFVAVSGDRLLVSTASGALEYQRSGTTWTYTSALLVPRVSSRTDADVLTALDGDRAAILMREPEVDADGGTNPELFLFERSSAGWRATTSFGLDAPLTTSGRRRVAFGGDDLVIGTGRDVRIYRRHPDGSWAFEAALAPDPGLFPNRLYRGVGFGRTVAVDGDTMFVTDQEAAAVFVYERRDGAWTLSQLLQVSNRIGDDSFGTDVALHGDVAWVGAALKVGGGSVFRYRRSGGAWSLEEELEPSERTTSSAFGASLATDGKRTLIGDPGQAGARGALFVYELSSTLGEPCTSASACVSGFCVDGVCCDGPCGGGRADDCVACNAKESEGTCAVTTAATVCRPATSTCDEAEACDGRSPTCPADIVAPNGTRCATGVCQAGSCVEAPDPAPPDASPARSAPASVPALESGCSMSHGESSAWPFVLLVVLAVLRRRRWLLVPALVVLLLPRPPLELESGDGAIRMHFTGHGDAEALARGSDARLTMRLRRLGRGADLREAGDCDPQRDGSRVVCDRAGVREWFEAGSDGLEHGFDLEAAPPGRGELVFDIAMTSAGLDYGDLVAIDARGRIVPSRVVTSATGVELRVDDRDARYPLVVDPRIWRRRQRLDPPFPRPSFGRAVAMHGDYLAVGQAGGDSVVVYRRDGAGWTIDGAAVPIEPQIPFFGFGSALAWMGEALVVGAPLEIDTTTRAGAVFLFERDAKGRWYETHRFDLADGNPTEIGSDLFGFVLAADGDTLVVGAPQTDYVDALAPTPGAVFVFERKDGVWTRRAKVSSAGSYNLGRSVAIHGDVVVAGTLLLDARLPPAYDQATVSLPLTAHVFTRADSEGKTWNETVLHAPDEPNLYGVAVATDGTDVFVGMPSVLGRRAAVFVYRGPEWKLVQELAAPEEVDLFGQAIAVHGDRLVVGAPLAGDSKGFVYVFERDSKGGWTQTSRLTADELAIDDRFGGALDFAEDLLVVGAPEHQHGAGAAYSFFLGQQGDACVNGTACASGLCVDGLCCDTACGGGDASDCLACSVAAGGSIDGECTPATRIVCRPARDECDLAESCDGTNVACPADVTAVNGTACREAGACYAGQCVDVLPISNVDAGVAPPPPVAPAADGCAIGRGSPRASSSFIALTLLCLLWRRKKDP